MCKDQTRSKPMESACRIIKKIFKTICRFLFGWFQGYILFFVVIILSWIAEVWFGKSLVEIHFPWATCPSFLRAPIILEAIKIVGFSTILIGWVYKSLDSSMLGLTYRDLLKHKFKLYHACSVCHICATVFCILSAASGASESAIVSLGAVLYGFFHQWIVLYQVVLNAKRRAQIAMDKWKQRVDESSSPMDCLLKIVNSPITPESEHYDAYRECIAIGFAKYCNSAITDNSLREVAYFWSNIFVSSKNQDYFSVVKSVFCGILNSKNCSVNKGQRQKMLNLLLAGYLVYEVIFGSNDSKAYYDEYAKNCNSDNFATLASRIAVLSVCLIEEADNENAGMINSAINCLKTNYSVLAWVYFLRGNIALSPQILCLIPSVLERDFVEYVVFSLIPSINQKDRDQIKETINRALTQCQYNG